ncbi:acetyl-CoA carboxylase biotin carboxyl carrier protein subunit [Pedobacter sp. MC2016-05]|uniref:acetyl-CoA carboxylase biotin carboxyl carrier protein subunit n=1 Tax=Pedobacter sp. MC2016-05 TaxID=2994474 RepID=UPI0022465D46|nr:acetyl-CoA carboxylase biotin carboxyl carrier protein subunit [Pedobacter sp. MC2016-05]MCX2473110.1 acetyl-CoA carboxylase biotin carboxyl carrier protein subunit [Pedobacter sp. MC2016-05]
MYKVKVNDQLHYDIRINHNGVKLNGENISLDSIKLSNNSSHLLYKNKSYNAEVISVDSSNKTCAIKVNRAIYQIKVEDQFDQLLKQMGMDNLAGTKISEVKAPMPGLVLNVMVEENVEVKKGDSLLVLEAMKMENILKSSAEGIVKKVLINKGDKVEKNQVLIQFK